MQNIMIKTATPLSLVTLLFMGSVSVESQANEYKVDVLSGEHNMEFVLTGMRGKPPYNRVKMKRQRTADKQFVEMSALEVDEGSTAMRSSQGVSKRRFFGGHPDHTKKVF